MTDRELDKWAAWAGEAIRAALSSEEAERLERHVQPLADAGRGVLRSADAYVVAIRPA